MSEMILSFPSAEKFLGNGVITRSQMLGALKFFVKDTKASIFDFIQVCSNDPSAAGKKRMNHILRIVSVSTSLLSYCSPEETLTQTLERLSAMIAIDVDKLGQRYHKIVGGWMDPTWQSGSKQPSEVDKVRLLGIRQMLESYGYKIIA